MNPMGSRARPQQRNINQQHQQEEQSLRKQGEWTNLPITQYRQTIIDRIYYEKCVICIAETGSGKTTQIPQYLADALDKFPNRIICTQPRAIAAMSIAERVAQEYENVDDISDSQLVGFDIGGKQKGQAKRILFTTESQLIKQTLNYNFWDQVSVIIIDEAHERNLYTDIVLGICKKQLQFNYNLSVVVTSATIDPKKFEDYLNLNEEPLYVKGRTFPVSVEYKPDPSKTDNICKIDTEFVISTCKTETQKTQGHTIVFLSGVKDIEKCLESFQNQQTQNSDFIALPLYGQLPPEEQQKIFDFDENHPGKRMVVFTTNVAETSITVPGIKLVIDSGLQKEVNYDDDKKIKVLQSKMISKSSANQRKGRAGRVSQGKCIRLFSNECYDDLEESHKPEILRSCLDLVVLQLLILKLDPLNFDFIDRPDYKLIQSSLQQLKNYGCIDQQQQITQTGLLFFNLPFPPRLSKIADICHKGGNLKMGATICSILNAPGEVFYIGGESQEERNKKIQLVALKAKDFESDIELYYNTFKKWEYAGEFNKCDRCVIQQKQDCYRCKVKYSVDNNLNNKILQIVDSSISETLKVFSKFDQEVLAYRDKSQKESYFLDQNSINMLDQALYQTFSDNICEVIEPSMPQLGVRILLTNEKGQINVSSFSQQKELKNKYLIAVEIIKLSDKFYLANKINPIKGLNNQYQIQQQYNPVELIYTMSNIGRNFSSIFTNKNLKEDIMQYIQKKKDNDYRQIELDDLFIQGYHEKQKSEGYIYSNTTNHSLKQKIKDYFDNKVKDTFATLENKQSRHLMNNGEMLLTIDSKFEVIQQKSEQKSLQICIKTPNNVQNENDLFKWLEQYKTGKEAVLYHKFLLRNNQICIQFSNSYHMNTFTNNKEIQQKYLVPTVKNSNILLTLTDSKDIQFLFSKFPNIKSKLILNFTLPKQMYNLKELKINSQTYTLKKDYQPPHFEQNQNSIDLSLEILNPQLIKILSQNNNNNSLKEVMDILQKQIKGKSSLVISNINGDDISYTKQSLKNQFGLDIQKMKTKIYHESKKDPQPADITVELTTQIDNKKLNYWVQKQNWTAITQNMRGKQFQNEIQPKIFFKKDPQPSGNVTLKRPLLECSFSQFSEVQDFYEKQKNQVINHRIQQENENENTPTYSTYFKYQTDLYSGSFIQSLKTDLLEKNRKQLKNIYISKHSDTHSQILFQSFNPFILAQIRNKLKSYFEPSIIQLKTKQQKLCIKNLQEQNYFQQQQQVYKYIKIEVSNDFNILILNGMAEYRAQVGVNLVKEFDKMAKQYHEIDLSAQQTQFFMEKKAGRADLDELNQTLKNGNKGEIDFNLFEQKISIFVKNSNDLSNIKTKTQNILNQYKGEQKNEDSQQENISTGACDICKKQTKDQKVLRLRICGHSLCQDCAKDSQQNYSIPLICPIKNCKFQIIHKSDLNELLRDIPTKDIIHKSYKTHLQKQPNQSKFLCYCDQILDIINGQVICLECDHFYCNNCKSTNKLHMNITCNEYKDLQSGKSDLEKLYQQAQKFVKDNWLGMSQKQEYSPKFFRNTYLLKNCDSWKIFEKGIKQLNTKISEGFFTWHGTSEQAIDPICQGGWDTNRRSGQVYGTGEYFGVNPQISDGYCRGQGKQIISYVLKKAPVKHQENYCYVVNNPLGNQVSFCLPVLIISYRGSTDILNVFKQEVPVQQPNRFSQIEQQKQYNNNQNRQGLYKFLWRKDDGTMEPYKFEMNDFIQAKYTEYKRNPSNYLIETPPIRRYVDDIPQVYIIDFKNKKQINKKTNYERKFSVLKRQIQK